jgi:dihydroflavonol-4-reductase
MKILVTGANGFLGAHIVRVLLNNKYEVRAMIRKGSNLSALKDTNYELFEGQITQKEDIKKAVKNCDYVIHVAARTSQTPSNLETFRIPNVESTRYIMDACKKYNVKRFVFVSTANCFGNGTKENPTDERRAFLPWLKDSGYAYSKYLAQQMVIKESVENELNAVVVNPTFLIGANDIKPSSGQILSSILNKNLVYFPPGGKNFVDVETAADGVVRALEKGEKGECSLLAGENHSYKEFFQLINKITKRKALLIPIPKWTLLILGWAGSFIEKVLKTPVQLTSANAKMLCLGNYFTPAKAIKELDFKLTATKESAEKAILWFQKNNYFN